MLASLGDKFCSVGDLDNLGDAFLAEVQAGPRGDGEHRASLAARRGAGRRALTPGAPWRIVLTEQVRQHLSGGRSASGVGRLELAARWWLSKSHVAYLVNPG